MNGFIAERARENGLSAPTHEMLTSLIKRIERGDIAASPQNLLLIFGL